ncbi:MAG TPA: PBP1A family penicillin-binding protein [Cerasibacillus sp.]|uniref:transglycosylase domain-containing protein n=1 Tax=Cerasibacillus sp. TaxID=2498711 RepID=UPI002F3F6D1B
MVTNNQTRMGRKKQNKQQKQQKQKKPIWKKIILSILVLILAMGIGVMALFGYYIATAPNIDASKLSDPFSSKVLDKNGEVFGNLGSEKRTKIVYDDLPEVLVDAVIATEDSRFFKHPGIDIKRIGGAIIANIKHGFGSEGASTITQQVAENAFLASDKKLKLKVQEQWIALKLERQYSKEQILEMYLNKIFYGNGAYGVARAAEVYFGKTDLHELTLPEAAILAGLPQRPTAYNPFKNPDLTKKRMNTVLDLMVRHDKITKKDADEARKVDIESLLTDSSPQATQFQAFIQQVEKEVKEKVDGANIYTDGLKIYTTLDPGVQKHVEFLLTDQEQNPIKFPNDTMQSGMVVVDTKTGAIQAIGGRRNSQGDEFNYAQAGFQPASTAKPIMAYGPAIEFNKWSTYHQINDDKPYEIAGSNPIRNHNRAYQGWVSARYALTHSLNVPAVKTYEEVGADKVKQFAEGLGIKFPKTGIDIRDPIGGTDTSVSPIQMAGAFQAFGNEGIYIEPHTVTKVEFPDGKVIELTPEPKAAMNDYTAYMVTDMLKSVVREGTGRGANIAGIPIAGKTGTTNENKDSWFVGYSTNYTISVWTGNYDEEDKRQPIPSGYTGIARDLFRNTMTEISKNIETPDFKMPDSVVKVNIEKGSNPPTLPSSYTPSSQVVTELFVKGTEPKQSSVKYDRLDPVKGLQATFDEGKQAIHVKWSHDKKDDVQFEVSTRINGGQMNVLSTTDDTELEIKQVELGAEYDIQVVAISKDDSSLKSNPQIVKVRTGPDEDDDSEEDEDNDDEQDEPEEETIPSVQNLSANYKGSMIQVNWGYNGPPASFEVSVNGQKEMKNSMGVNIKGAQPGETYTIVVTAIGKQSGKRSEANSVQITIPNDEQDENNNQDDDDEDGEQ